MGQGLVEFALALPVLMLILMGAVDLGRAFSIRIAVTNASREGARFGISHPTDVSGIKNHAIQEASGSGVSIAASDISIACFDYNSTAPLDCASARNGDRLQVTVKASFDFITLYLFRVPAIPVWSLTIMPIVNGVP